MLFPRAPTLILQMIGVRRSKTCARRRLKWRRHVAAGLGKSETRRPNYWGLLPRPRRPCNTKPRNACQAALDLASQLMRAPPWLRDREGESSKPFVATSARWALAASLRKALLEEENGSDPIIRQAALRCAVSALKRATPATLDVLLAHQLPRALAARITGDDALSAAKALALFLEPPWNGHWKPPSPFPLSVVGDEDDEAALRSADGVSTSVRERFALRRRVEKAVAEAVGDDAQSEPARGLSAAGGDERRRFQEVSVEDHRAVRRRIHKFRSSISCLWCVGDVL